VVYLLAIAADAFLGIGWVLQQRVAAHARSSKDAAWRVLRRLIATPVWWAGIAAMAVGQSLAAGALQAGSVALVEPLLVGCLLFAFGFAAWRGKQRVTLSEVVGTLIVIGGVALFLGAADPQPDVRTQPDLLATLAAAASVAALAAAIIAAALLAGRRHRPAAASAAFAAAAGAFYALQDVATRGAIDVVQEHDLAALIQTSWPYVLLAAATAGVLVSQAAFRAARLDWSLPPTVAAQPIVGVAMAVALLGDTLRVTPVAIVFQAISLPLTLAGVLILGRSGTLRRADRPSRHDAKSHRTKRAQPSAART
jgi:drug/metabolite transporter (DMT)-like permease